MIDLYTWPTPNGHKIHIMLEECGLPYNVIPIDIGAGDQFNPEFLKISPNNKMPAMVDPDGPDGKPIAMFESGAILIYLAEKTGKFLPADPRAALRRAAVADVPDGQHRPDARPGASFPAVCARGHRVRRATAIATRPTASTAWSTAASARAPISRATTTRIADIAVWPWTRFPERQGVERAEYPNFVRWFDEIAARPAVQRGVEVLADRRRDLKTDKQAWEIMFGSQAVRAALVGLRQPAGAGRRRRVTVAAGCCSCSGSRAVSGR